MAEARRSISDHPGHLTLLGNSSSLGFGVNQGLFTSDEDLAGIMGAPHWKSPRMRLVCNRDLAAEQGAADRLIAKIG